MTASDRHSSGPRDDADSKGKRPSVSGRASDGSRDTTVDVVSGSGPASGLEIRCPHCHQPFRLSVDASLEHIACVFCGSSFNLVDEDQQGGANGLFTRIGHFELLDRIGMGSFGTVWKARDTKLDRLVALKIPRRAGLSVEEKEKFLREARAAAQLNHPRIVAIHEMGRVGDTIYIATDLVSGVDLLDWYERQQPTADEAAELVRKICESLEHAHAAGVIHRDLKPQNIMVDDQGEPHVMDFGLARRVATDVTVTFEGQILGTPAYISPEQAAGHGHNADQRSDVYSIGVILFQLLTGHLPFRGDSRRLLEKAMHDEAPSPRRFNSLLDYDLETICLKCLEKEPAKRYATAQALADDLGRYLRREPILARPVGPLARTWRWCKRNALVASLLGLVFVTMLIGSIVSVSYALLAARHAADLRSSLYESRIAQAQATRAVREEGYRSRVFGLLNAARTVDPERADLDELRNEASLSLGDFVGLDPIHHAGFSESVTVIALHPTDSIMAVGLLDGTILLRRPEDSLDHGRVGWHKQRILAIGFRTDGSEMISVDDAGLVAIHDWSESGGLRRRADGSLVDGETERLRSVMITADARWIVATHQHHVAVWQVDPLRRIHRCDVPGDTAESDLDLFGAVLRPDGEQVASWYSGSDGENGLIVWNVKQEQMVFRDPRSLGQAYAGSMAFGPDSHFFAFGCDEGLVVFDATTWQQHQQFRSDAIKSVAFSDDARLLATVNIRGKVLVRSVSGGREVARLTNPRQRSSRERITFSPNGRYLASSHADAIRVWDLKAAHERIVLAGHSFAIPTITYAPDGRTVITGGKGASIIWWDAESGQRLESTSTGRGNVQVAACSRDGRWMVSAHWDDPEAAIRVWDLAERRQIGSILEPKMGDVCGIALWGEGRYLAASGKGLILWELPEDWNADSPREMFYQGGEQGLFVTVSPDEETIAWVEDGDRVRLLDIASRTPRSFNGPAMQQGWHGLAFLPDGKRLVYVDQESRVVVWDVERDALAFTVGEANSFTSPHIAVSDDGRWLAGLEQAGQVAIWDLESRAKWLLLPDEGSSIWSMDWQPGRRRLAISCSDGGAAIWDLDLAEKELSKIGLAQ